jgi:hypothetical protein
MRARTLGLLFALAVGGVVVGDVTPGETRAVQAREGAWVRAEAKSLATKVKRLPLGTRVTVQEVNGAWAHVSSDDGTTGWLRTSELVEPGALTGHAAAQAAGGSADVSLAGRQFDEATEGEMRATEADLNAAYPLVDEMEKKSIKPGSPELDQFIAEGRLGHGK